MKYFLTVVVIMVAALVAYLYFSRQSDCDFSEWKRTIGVELESQVNDLKAIKGNLGVSDSHLLFRRAVLP